MSKIKIKPIEIELIKKKVGKKYCAWCGKKLLITIVGAEYVRNGEVDWEEKYDEETGKRRHALHYECPNERWWNLFSNHYDYYELFDKEMEEIIEGTDGEEENN